MRALEVLFSLGALDDDARLTRPLGTLLADMPLEPMLGKALLCSGWVLVPAGWNSHLNTSRNHQTRTWGAVCWTG